MDTQIKEALANVRTSAQGLHTAVNDAAARQAEILQADLQAAETKARAVAESIRKALGAQNDAAKIHMRMAMTALDAFQRHAEAALKDAATAMRTAVGQAQGEAQACVKEVGEAAREMRAR